MRIMDETPSQDHKKRNKMLLKYVGPKAMITRHGIDFDNNKEDKFVYLNIALQLIKALDHEYIPNKLYSFDAHSAHLTPEDIERMTREYCDNIDAVSEDAEDAINRYLDYEIARARRSRSMSDIEIDAMIKNLNMMRGYMTQRAINKRVYYELIDKLAEILKRDNIDYVIAPMFQKFAHVFHSVQGVLRSQKAAIDSKIEIYEQDGQLFTKLDIKNT